MSSRHHRTVFVVVAAVAAILSAFVLPCRADSHALLIGIDEYQQRDRINSLAGAAADAAALAKTLEEVGGFPRQNIHLLTSETKTKPTGSNILFQLEQLSKNVKPGDMVFVMFSGHGIAMDGASYLLPWEADARDETVLKRTALLTREVQAVLARLPARALVLVFDMCRNDPRKGGRTLAADNTLGRQARDLVIRPVGEESRTAGPRAVVTLFACREQERSWEWRTKGRGYFSYFLEQGLRGAASRGGAVRVPDLVAYLEKEVPAAVKRNEGQRQTPFLNVEGTGALEVVLSQAARPLPKSPVRPPIIGPAPIKPPVPARTKLLLVVTVTKGFRHNSIPTAEAVLTGMADRNGIGLEFARTDSDLALRMTPEGLARYDGVLFANTSGDLPLPDAPAFVQWVRDGHAFIGIHAAADTLRGFLPYSLMLGALFSGHGGIRDVQCLVADGRHPAGAALGGSFSIRDEIFLFSDFDRSRNQVLLHLDRHPIDGTPGDLPLAWCRSEGRGRVFYTALGHLPQVWQSVPFQSLLLGGIRWAIGLDPGQARP